MRIAIVGSGIAGLGAAHLLAPVHDVHVFEADARPGGHANTVIHRDGRGIEVPIDTGFLVHSRENYPLLVRLFDELGVQTTSTTMSLSVSCDHCGIEYSGARPWAQVGNLAGMHLVRLFGEIVRFAARAEGQVRPHQTLAQFLAEGGYSAHFERHFLLPLTAALWSAPATATRDFPAAYVIGFMAHHGMLRLRRFTWRTVVGGSRTYVDRLVAGLPNGVRLATPVEQITRFDDGVEVRAAGTVERFDQVIMACHADQALAVLSDPSPDEERILAAIPFTTNPTVLHTDTALLPRRKAARAAWNYRTRDCRLDAPTVTVTYDVSRLQQLPGPERYLVTLNGDMPIDPNRVLATIDYTHPRYTFEMLEAQKQMSSIDGVRRTWFCGAWRGFGFHEDGLRSAHEVAVALGGGWR